MLGLLQVIGVIVYIGIGFVQLGASFAGVNAALGLHGLAALIIGGLVGMFVAWLPLVGTAAGIYGAYTAWHWHLLSAVLLFGFPMVIYAALLLIFGIAALFGKEA